MMEFVLSRSDLKRLHQLKRKKEYPRPQRRIITGPWEHPKTSTVKRV